MGNKEQCLNTTHNKTESKVGKIIISTDNLRLLHGGDALWPDFKEIYTPERWVQIKGKGGREEGGKMRENKEEKYRKWRRCEQRPKATNVEYA